MKNVAKLEEQIMELMLSQMLHTTDPLELWKMLERYDKLVTAHAKRTATAQK